MALTPNTSKVPAGTQQKGAGYQAPNPESKRQKKFERRKLLEAQSGSVGQSSATDTPEQIAASTERQTFEPIEEIEEDSDVIDFSDPEGLDEVEVITERDQEAETTVVPSAFRPLLNGEVIEDKLPATLADTDDWMYAKETAIWHQQTGGRDEPSPAQLKTTKNSATKSNVAITFRDRNQIMFTAGSLKALDNKQDADSMDVDSNDGKGKAKANVEDPTPAEAHAAASAPKTKDPKDNYHPVKVHWILNSQVPGFYLSVNRRAVKVGDSEDDNVPVTVHFHVNNMVSKKDEKSPNPRVCLTSGLGDDLAKRLDPKSGLEAQSNTSSGCLWGTEVEVWRPGCSELTPALTNAEPTFCNISKDELDLIRTKGDNANGDQSKLSPGDWVLHGLMRCTSFVMYRTWSKDDESMRVYDFFTAYMRALLNEVALMGNFPFYARQANQQLTNLHSENFEIEYALPPRNMVTSWRVTYEQNKPVKAFAETWSNFTPLISYPEARAKTFAMRLGIARTRPTELAAVQEAIDKFLGKMSCDFMKLSSVGTYYGEIFLSNSEGNIFVDNGVKAPVPNTRVTIEVTGGQFMGKKLTGVVIPDVYGRNRDICVSVYVLKGHAEFPKALTNADVSLEFADDSTPCDRQNAAMVQLGRGTHRTYGVDFQSALLECPSVIEDTGSLHNEVKASASAKAAWDDSLREFVFTPEQVDALECNFTSESGLTIVYGPPGTGKTYTQMAGMLAHISVGHVPGVKRRTVLATAPSHAAVDNNLKTFVNLAKKAKKDVQVCRFRGGAMSPYMGKSRTDNAAIKEALFHLKKGGEEIDDTAAEFDADAHAIWESIDASTKSNKRLGAGVIPEYEFPVQRKAFITRLAKDKTSPFHQDARDYLVLKKEIIKATGEEKKKLRENLDLWDQTFNQRYFDQVDIVFVTNNGSAHPLLTLHYKPRILSSDEVGQASLVDQATPIAAFIDYLELFWATGDHQQQGPMPLAKGSNETIGDVSKSPFEMLFNNRSIQERIMLLEQRRMRPVISGMVSRLWYKGLLRDSQSVLSATPLEQTILQAYEKLKPHWNGTTRMMVDVGGPNVLSEKYGDRSSLYNKAEADLILNHIEYLLDFVPSPVEGEEPLPRVQQDDIMIITGYSGQTMYIIQELWRRRINIPGEGEVRVKEVRTMTSGSVQGGEAPIILHSMVRNTPGKALAMGFTRKTNQLCVNFSRAQIHHVTFGNVKALMQAKINEAGQFAKGGMLYTWGQILQDFYDQKEMLSGAHLAALHNGRVPDIGDAVHGQFTPSTAKTGWNMEKPGAGVRGRGRGRGGRGGSRGGSRGGRGGPRGDGGQRPGERGQLFVMREPPRFTPPANAMRANIEAQRVKAGNKRVAAHEKDDQRMQYEPAPKKSKDGDKEDGEVVDDAMEQ
jgi:hypothetical protein